MVSSFVDCHQLKSIESSLCCESLVQCIFSEKMFKKRSTNASWPTLSPVSLHICHVHKSYRVISAFVRHEQAWAIPHHPCPTQSSKSQVDIGLNNVSTFAAHLYFGLRRVTNWLLFRIFYFDRKNNIWRSERERERDLAENRVHTSVF